MSTNVRISKFVLRTTEDLAVDILYIVLPLLQLEFSSANIELGSYSSASFVIPQAHLQDLGGERFCILLGIAWSYSSEHQNSFSNGRNELFVNRDRG